MIEAKTRRRLYHTRVTVAIEPCKDPWRNVRPLCNNSLVSMKVIIEYGKMLASILWTE